MRRSSAALGTRRRIFTAKKRNLCFCSGVRVAASGCDRSSSWHSRPRRRFRACRPATPSRHCVARNASSPSYVDLGSPAKNRRRESRPSESQVAASVRASTTLRQVQSEPWQHPPTTRYSHPGAYPFTTNGPGPSTSTSPRYAASPSGTPAICSRSLTFSARLRAHRSAVEVASS